VQTRKIIVRVWLPVVAATLIPTFCIPAAFGQAVGAKSSAILQQYQNAATTWFSRVYGYAQTLFALLATIEFAWSGALLLLERSDLQSWVTGVIRKLMWLGVFYALLLNGRWWIPAIIRSFELIGQNASGSGPLDPSDVFLRGSELAGALLAGAGDAGFLSAFGTALAMVFAALMMFLAFVAVTVQFIVAMVESYIVISAGVIFLGFGGSRWTSTYVERYIGLAVSTGVKIMVLYLLIGLGMGLSGGWLDAAGKIVNDTNPAMGAFEIAGAGIIFAAVCWQAPKLFAAVMGGSPALTGGDLVGMAAGVGFGALAAGAGIATGGAALAGSGAAGAASGGGGLSGGGLMSVSQAAGLSASGPAATGSSGTMGAGGAAAPDASPAESASGVQAGTSANTGDVYQPLPPSPSPTANPVSPAGSGDTGSALRRGLDAAKDKLDRTRARVPSDAAPHTTPPKMPIDQTE
jgi:type IV secretion system protein TrbL